MENQTPNHIPTPFENIALSLSGGGYRATTFHLGAMAYLDEQNYKGQSLLRHVKIVSTISGGTLTGVMYALKIAKGEGFQECFDKLYQLLSEDKLVDHALHKINYPSNWKNTFKSRDMINAFAEVYNEHFYDEATFKTLYEGDAGHLTDVIFGTSEFTYGIQFRLQEEQDQGRFGNGYLNLPEDVAKNIRFGDAAAASSCFPGGFEPMVMPKDFGDGPESIVDKTWYGKSNQDGNYPTTAIMDGGVIDNQGIEGVKLAEKRHSKDGKAFIGTYIVSDVSSEMMDPYVVPVLEHVRWKNLLTLNSINIIALIIATTLGVLLFMGIPFLGIIISSSILTIIGLWFVLYIFIHGKFKSAIKNAFGESMLPELLKDFGVIRRTPIYILIYLIQFRVTSVMKMVSDVFLRRIRRLQLDRLYKSANWDYRFKSNYIYSLQKHKMLSPKMKEVVKAATHMPTTLWFSEKDKKENMLDKLIACGQFTMCYNLIRYIERLRSDKYLETLWNKLPEQDRLAIGELEESMKDDWNKFQEDPYWLLHKNTGMEKLKG